ncbi:hypothetical protein Nepgr_011820 [Nepenthes gracilis]|uniref:GIR1-like zinc ribbon domain-containing protein n=1 Tax=Nepenthes gracilis TaxID=150966 RepID=A0AAD3SG00_NEPGR|nr:hypothetical protein Nepgr_011820 [Nepenthes gracilis]
MALDVQKQQPPQPSHVSGGATSVGGSSTGAGLTLRRSPPVTLNLFGSTALEHPSPLPSPAQNLLHIKEEDKYRNSWENLKFIMDRKNGNGSKIDLKLNLSPPRMARGEGVELPSSSVTISPPSSCVSSEEEAAARNSDSPEATSMVLVGCPRCLMYVMLSENDPRCPKCKSTVLLNFPHDTASAAAPAATSTAKKTRKR